MKDLTSLGELTIIASLSRGDKKAEIGSFPFPGKPGKIGVVIMRADDEPFVPPRCFDESKPSHAERTGLRWLRYPRPFPYEKEPRLAS